MIEKSIVAESLVEKSGVEVSGVEVPGVKMSCKPFRNNGVPSAENREPLRVPNSAKVTGSKSCKSSMDLTFRLLST